ncbi:MAG: hypothetical protein QOJ51_2416, partial [Acidobacteriaceae bacterium]|nr:hypothetical protein [Acidobacteriaceae bacterium]
RLTTNLLTGRLLPFTVRFITEVLSASPKGSGETTGHGLGVIGLVTVQAQRNSAKTHGAFRNWRTLR